MDLGVALRSGGKDFEAEEAYRRAIRLDPKYEEAYYNLGVLLEVERPSEAQALFRTALALDPDYACAYRELGYGLSNRGPNPESESHLRKAIQLEPGDACARIYRGTYLWESEEVDAAVSEFRIAGLSLCPPIQPRSCMPNARRRRSSRREGGMIRAVFRQHRRIVIACASNGELRIRKARWPRTKGSMARALRKLRLA
jgi:Flp pilus assembly protein TadD